MADVTVSVRDNGPFLVKGALTLVDAEGKPFPIDSSKPLVALCRCGQSSNRPFCDGTHNRCGFESAERAPA